MPSKKLSQHYYFGDFEIRKEPLTTYSGIQAMNTLSRIRPFQGSGVASLSARVYPDRQAGQTRAYRISHQKNYPHLVRYSIII